MPNPTKPEPLYIADNKEGFLNWFADVLVERVIREVEEEQAKQASNNNPTQYENVPSNNQVPVQQSP